MRPVSGALVMMKGSGAPAYGTPQKRSGAGDDSARRVTERYRIQDPYLVRARDEICRQLVELLKRRAFGVRVKLLEGSPAFDHHDDITVALKMRRVQLAAALVMDLR